MGKESDLRAEGHIAIQRGQMQRYFNSGGADLLKLSEKQYRERFPNPAVQPLEYRGVFDNPLVVDPAVVEYLIEDVLPLQYLESDLRIENKIAAPTVPYIIWTANPRNNAQISAKALQDITGMGGAVVSPLDEIFALYLLYPNFFEKFLVQAPGSHDEFGRVPTCIRKPAELVIDMTSPDLVREHIGGMTRGRKIRIG